MIALQTTHTSLATTYDIPLLLPQNREHLSQLTDNTKGHQCGKRPFHHNNCYYDTKSFGLLVVLGFDVAVFTPAPYLRHRL